MALLLLCLAITMPSQVDAGCWNFITGSRCDNEALYGSIGFKTCAAKYGDSCRAQGYPNGAHCSRATENCLWFKRGANVCTCY